jgi:hypothetical protein
LGVFISLLGCGHTTSSPASGESESAAVAAIKTAGGELKQAFGDNAGAYSDIVFPKRSNGRVCDDDLKHLSAITDVRKLSVMDGADITDAGIAHLRGLKNLDYLFLSDTKLTDDGLANLEGMDRLHMVFLDNTQITSRRSRNQRGRG